jgi:hypothetical protein
VAVAGITETILRDIWLTLNVLIVLEGTGSTVTEEALAATGESEVVVVGPADAWFAMEEDCCCCCLNGACVSDDLVVPNTATEGSSDLAVLVVLVVLVLVVVVVVEAVVEEVRDTVGGDPGGWCTKVCIGFSC